MMSREHRALGALTGLALGDALGMPTQSMSRAQVAAEFGTITGLVDAPAHQPIAPGMPAGSVTDDTEQALLVAQLLVDGSGRVEPRAFSDALMAWEQQMRDKGSLDLLGPSTSAAIAAIAAVGEIPEDGSCGTTNGAAMRITPVALAVPSDDPDALLEAVHDLSFVTHNTGLGLSGAASVAGVVSASIDGADLDESLRYGLELSHRAEGMGHWIAGASIPSRAEWALQHTDAMTPAELADFLTDIVGTSVQAQESVVSSLVIAGYFRDRPFDGLCFAASIGGDTDTVAAMAGAMLGAVRGDATFPADAVRTVIDVSGIDLDRTTTQLLELRESRPTP